MATTHCPRCGKPAVLVDSRRIGPVQVSGAGRQDVVERRIVCPAPAGCGGDVLVVWRIDLFQGVDSKRNVPNNFPP